MGPLDAAQYGIAAFAVGVLSYVLTALIQPLLRRRSGNGEVAQHRNEIVELSGVLDRLASAHERLVLALERQTVLLEQQGRMLERLSERVDEVWRATRPRIEG